MTEEEAMTAILKAPTIKAPLTADIHKTKPKRGRKPSGPKEPSVQESKSLNAVGRLTVKIMAATKQMQKLTKGSHSERNDYAFVSIDDYYEQVALKVANDFGIGWQLSEEFDREERFQDVYSDFHIRKVFKVSLFSDEGDSFNPGFISVTLPYEDASTTGKALSYADKAFMRQLFKIPTGEKEAEQTPAVKRSEAGQQKDASAKERFFEKPVDGPSKT